MTLTKDQFFAATKFPTEAVEVPALGGTAYVRVMSALERDRFESHLLEEDGDDNASFRARLVAATACDEAGALLFDAADVDRLAGLPFTTLQPLADVALRLNKLRKADVEVERKNSETAPA